MEEQLCKCLTPHEYGSPETWGGYLRRVTHQETEGDKEHAVRGPINIFVERMVLGLFESRISPRPLVSGLCSLPTSAETRKYSCSHLVIC